MGIAIAALAGCATTAEPGPPPWALEIEYRRGVAVRLRARVPITIEAGCWQGAGWMGFSRPRNSLLDGPRCVWPGARVTHRLEKGYGGELNRDTRWFMVWLVDPFSPVA